MPQLTFLERHSLGDIQSPQLIDTLRAWRSIADRNGCYDYSADIAPVFNRPGILLPGSTMLLVEGDNPLGYLFAWFGAGFGLYGNRSYCGYSMGDLPDKNYAAVMAQPLATAVAEKEIAYHRVSCVLDGKRIAYERLILPMTEAGKVTAMVTASVSRDYPVARARRPGPH